jgi:transcriptional regulator with XRE-family HTH domain
MESTPGSRLAEWREFKGLTLVEMASITGISKTTINTVEQSGSSKPSYDTISRVLAGFPDLNPDWLLLGTGPMVRGRVLTPAPAAPVASAPLVAAEPTVSYGCLSPDFVALLTSEVTDLRAENKALDQELRHARREFREDFIAQARQYNSVKVGQESFIASQQELIKRLNTKIDEYELRLGIRQPTQQEREQLQGGSEPRMEVKPFGARYRETSYEDPQAIASDEPRGRVIEMYQNGEVSLCEAA